MSRVLYAWELGTGLGHILPFLPVAEALHSRGHELVWALRDTSSSDVIVDQHRFKVVQAPLCLAEPPGLPKPILSYAEILLHNGYLDARVLGGLARAWRSLYQLAAPDLVIADHAPTALLAAHALPTPVAQFGGGFFSPPQRQPVPGFLPWISAPPGRLIAAEAQVLDTINQTLTGFGVPPLARFADLFDSRENFLTTYAELDHYEQRGPANYCGAVLAAGSGDAPQWPDRPGQRVFAYLKPDYHHFEAMLGLLRESGHPVLAVCPGLSAGLAAKYASPSLRLGVRHHEFSRVTDGADLMVCHAGDGTVCGSLLAGKPLLLLPMTAEEGLVGRRVEEWGAGLMAPPQVTADGLNAMLQRLLAETSFAARARDFATRYGGRSQAQIVAAIVDRCEELLDLQPLSPRRNYT